MKCLSRLILALAPVVPHPAAASIGAALAGGAASVVTCEPARAQTLADYWSGRASFACDNALYGTNGMHFIQVVPHNGQFRVFGNLNTPAGLAVGVWNSADLLSFQFLGTAVQPGAYQWMSTFASFPGVYKEGNTWYLVFEAKGTASPGDIGLATSSDGLSFTVHPEPILVHRTSGWERNNIGTPWLTKLGTQWVLYYHGYGSRSGSPDDVQIGVATGTNLFALQRSSANPLIRTQSDEWDKGTVGRRDIVYEAGYYYMIAEISGDAPFAQARWSTGLWRSSSLMGPWEKARRSPVLPVTASGFGLDGPSWARTPDGRLHVYFRHPDGPTSRATLRWNSEDPPSTWTFQAESGPHHQVGRRDGTTWFCSQDADERGYAVYGPYLGIPAGRHVVTWKLRINSIEGDGKDVVATVDVFDATTGQRLGGIRPIRRSEFARGQQYQFFQIGFQSPGPGHQLEYRVYFHDRSSLRIDWAKVL